MQLRLDALKYWINKDDNDDERRDGGSGGGGDDGTPGPCLPRSRTPQQEMEDIVRGLDFRRGNTPDVSPDNTREQNSRIIAWKNQERFQNRPIKEREKELSNILKGIINKRKLSMNFNFPDTSPYTPSRSSPPPDDFSRYLAPSDFSCYLQPSPHFLEPTEPRKTSLLFSDGNKFIFWWK